MILIPLNINFLQNLTYKTHHFITFGQIVITKIKETKNAKLISFALQILGVLYFYFKLR